MGIIERVWKKQEQMVLWEHSRTTCWVRTISQTLNRSCFQLPTWPKLLFMLWWITLRNNIRLPTDFVIKLAFEPEYSPHTSSALFYFLSHICCVVFVTVCYHLVLVLSRNRPIGFRKHFWPPAKQMLSPSILSLFQTFSEAICKEAGFVGDGPHLLSFCAGSETSIPT